MRGAMAWICAWELAWGNKFTGRQYRKIAALLKKGEADYFFETIKRKGNRS